MENKFLKIFDKVKKRFNNTIKDDLFIEEIEAFKKYSIIDDNNMFNYIYTHNIYQLLIENPNEYKINIISKNKEQLSQFKTQLFNEDEYIIITCAGFESHCSGSYSPFGEITVITKTNINSKNLYQLAEEFLKK